jgi:hypothetical protein
MLEKVAVCLQHNLCRQCQSGDAVIDMWVQNATARKAAALRELKKWVLTPKSDTRNQFIARIAANLSQVTSGNWDALELMEPGKISRLQLWRSYGVVALRRIFKAGVPVLVFWAFQQTSLAFKGGDAEYVRLGACSYAVLTLIMPYDQPFGAKTTALKEVMQSLAGIGSLLGKHKKE